VTCVAVGGRNEGLWGLCGFCVAVVWGGVVCHNFDVLACFNNTETETFKTTGLENAIDPSID
jgi:hypothetical protein